MFKIWEFKSTWTGLYRPPLLWTIMDFLVNWRLKGKNSAITRSKYCIRGKNSKKLILAFVDAISAISTNRTFFGFQSTTVLLCTASTSILSIVMTRDFTFLLVPWVSFTLLSSPGELEVGWTGQIRGEGGPSGIIKIHTWPQRTQIYLNRSGVQVNQFEK